MDKSELYEKSMRTLELPQVLVMLSAEAVSEPAKELCAALRPADAPQLIPCCPAAAPRFPG